ncbi:Zinc finger C2H2-type,Zinc finger, RING/FYVE/PHD-type,SET domain [Cinara cedri]|uniref:Zinc finger C2H2-type,Zinc finger, RING/FYVE/PHD-type,SET domain n=1 Tax=Cinara cedri TaxID=506608 RepID=A0A5E4MY83_9HEMI|nr:Zinc finger C2H2-type,Zinc finger, RING/FYVE/PHD-type,SET domain [Cinara cedri]
MKPQMRLAILRDHIIPMFIHGLTFGVVSAGKLRTMSHETRSTARSWLDLPVSCSNSYIHSPTSAGGLGIPSPEVSFKRNKLSKGEVLSYIDDACTAGIIDPRLGVTTHKMGLHSDDDVFPLTRPVFKTIEATHHKFYEMSVSAVSRIENFIDKNTVLHEVSGHHFQFDQDLIVPGVNDFSLIYSGRSKKNMHVLLGPISFVNHSCLPNCEFKPNDGGRICLVTLKKIFAGDELTVSYSTQYFGDHNQQCLCALSSMVCSVVEHLCNKVVTDCGDDIESAVKKKKIKKMYRCKFCPMSFKYKSHLYRHKATHIDPQWFCNVCKMKFAREDTLNRHMMKHGRIRPEYRCRLCPKKFKHFESLKHHIQQKHSEEPQVFVCKVCQKELGTKKTLRYHLNVHGSIKPFKCPTCLESFHQPCDKSRHMKKMHPV